ncbi:uncharacterized protein LOC111379057 [Olea europaea var. sylvestris]|uniref:uncharacterized protein LOC111379057 n=1 Tax=Olea europaea var. sylvestris TaxID=158386 RepID=UPI000C1D0E19|nr:uncharacterized protein LOC111379057 [Olea europaea var. sylvestris]
MNFMEFLIVDSRSAYHGILGRPVVKELGAVTSIHHLCMKFSMKNGVATVRGDQRGSRECYLSSIKKVEPRDVHVIIVDIVMADVPGDAPTEPEDIHMIDAPPNLKVLVIDEIDPRIIEHEPQASPVEERKNFMVDPRDPSKMLRVGKGLSNILKEKIKDFLSKNLDVFAWKHENMVGIDPKVSCHHLKVDPKVAPHRQKRRALNLERYEALKEEVQKLIQNGFIREATYPRMMPFGLKNAGATYQRLVNKMFMDLIGKTMEVYVNNMLVKSLEAKDHITHLNSTFQILRRYRMRLNPFKCAFGVASGKFLGYMVNQRGIEANPKKIEALHKMRSPQKPKEVQSLIGQVAALSHFVSKATDKCLPFFKAPLLSKPKPGEILQQYLAVSNGAISSVLTRKEGTTQLAVYYTSKVLLSLETRYPDMEKFALALITASRKLRPSFQAYTIHVLINFPLRQVLQKPDALGRLLKWAVELSEFDLVFKARAAIKGQALADFVVEFTNLPEVDEIMELIEPPTWNLFIDGSAGDASSGAGVILISPKGHKLNSVVRFGFKATNNVAEYEALLAGLRLAKEMQVKRLLISSDSQLVVSQIPRMENYHADTLSKLTSSKDSELLTIVPIKHFLLPSTEAPNRSFSSPPLRCVGEKEATYILRKVCEGVCDNHSGGLSLVQKISRQGYYWPTLKRDTLEFARKCDKCQRFSSVQRQPS